MHLTIYNIFPNTVAAIWIYQKPWPDQNFETARSHASTSHHTK